MPKIRIEPQTVLLTLGQAATFHAIDDAGQGVAVSWSLNPPTSNFATPAAGTAAPSATYVAPPIVATAQTIAVIASANADSASATIYLTPDAISIVPAKADLQAGQQQEFVAIVAGAAPVTTAPIPPGAMPAATAPTPSSSVPVKVTWI